MAYACFPCLACKLKAINYFSGHYQIRPKAISRLVFNLIFTTAKKFINLYNLNFGGLNHDTDEKNTELGSIFPFII
jgi:hypothetical protein